MEQVSIQDNFFQQYRTISIKIKKRFLRKPNIAEASEDFSKLARKLTETEALPQAALCCLAVAKCEQSLCNPMTEVSSLLEAARNFMKAEEGNQLLGCTSYDEHMIAGISAYQLAINIYLEQQKKDLAASLQLELSEMLETLGHTSEALCFAEEAVGNLQTMPMYLITCQNRIARCKINLGDLNGALKSFFEISRIINTQEESTRSGCYQDILSECEVSSLFLLLTLQPLMTQLRPEHTRLLDKYSWNAAEESFQKHMKDNRELTILLQSLILSCQSRDLEALADLAEKLSSKLSGQTLNLLRILVTEMNRS